MSTVELKGNDDAFESPLIGTDNVVLTPRVGGSTPKTQDNIGIKVAAGRVRYSDNGSTLSAVNFPKASLPEHPSSKRLLHVHRNVPGMLSQVHENCSKDSVTIEGRQLLTDPTIAYVVIDVSIDEAKIIPLRETLAAIPGTLRTRVLY